MIRVAPADEQPWLRSAVRLLIEQEAEIQIVGEVADAAALLRAAAAWEPDLILLDWELPGL